MIYVITHSFAYSQAVTLLGLLDYIGEKLVEIIMVFTYMSETASVNEGLQNYSSSNHKIKT